MVAHSIRVPDELAGVARQQEMVGVCFRYVGRLPPLSRARERGSGGEGRAPTRMKHTQMVETLAIERQA